MGTEESDLVPGQGEDDDAALAAGLKVISARIEDPDADRAEIIKLIRNEITLGQKMRARLLAAGTEPGLFFMPRSSGICEIYGG